MTWNGSSVLMFEGFVFAEIHGGLKIRAVVHARYPEYTVKHYRACSHVRNEKLNECRRMNRA